MFGVRSGAYLKDGSFGKAPALLTNIRLGWKGLSGTKVKRFITLGLGVKDINFSFFSTKVAAVKKLECFPAC
jgi:hypothetical protein